MIVKKLSQNTKMDIANYSVQKKMKLFYFCAAVFLASFFIFLIFQPVATIYHEEDLWWLLPTIAHISENNSFLETVKIFLFDPYPTNRGEPSMNLYVFFISSVLGFQTGYFIFTSLFVHLCCAVLLYFLARETGLEFRIAFFAALTYAVMFIHFDYYIYTVGSQHLVAIFFTLLVLTLYLNTTNRIDRNECWRPYFWLTLFVNFLASFCQVAILILPASILAHILICSKDGEDRINKYDIWLPLFITYLGYILIRFLYYGYPHLEFYLHIKEQGISIYSVALFPVIFVLALAAIFFFRVVLKLYDVDKFRRALKVLLLSSIGLYLFVFLAVYGNERLLIGMPRGRIPLFYLLSPYNLIRPLVGMFMSFLEPFKMALSIDSAKARNYIPIQDDLVFLLLTLFLVFLFYKKFFVRHKGAVIFLIPYLFALRNMTEFFLWDKHGTIPSRYFVYITPLFSILFCSVFVYLYFLVIDKTRMKSAFKDIILILLFIGLCMPNILAVKFEIFKNKLLNTRYIYDYIRISELIKEGLSQHNRAKRLSPADIYIDGVLPMPFGETDYDFSPVSPQRFDNFRYTFAQAFNDRAMLNVNVNRLPGKNEKGIVYKIDNTDIKDMRNLNIDEFSKDRDEAISELSLKHYNKAAVLFKKAIQRRPFLFRYMLAGYKPEDSGWITNGRSIRQWVYDMTNYYCAIHPQKKIIYLAKILNAEIDDYIECLFYAAYLQHLAGRDEESKYLYSQICFIEDCDAAFARLGDSPLIKSDQQMLSFLSDAKMNASRSRTRGDSFSKFIFNLLLNKDTVRPE